MVYVTFTMSMATIIFFIVTKIIITIYLIREYRKDKEISGVIYLIIGFLLTVFLYIGYRLGKYDAFHKINRF